MLLPITLTVLFILAVVAAPICYRQADYRFLDPDRSTSRAVLLGSGTAAFLAALACGILAVRSWIIYFQGSVSPLLGQIGWCAGTVAGIAAVFVYLIRASRAKREGGVDEDGNPCDWRPTHRNIVLRNYIAAVLAGVIALGLAVPAIMGFVGMVRTNNDLGTGIPEPSGRTDLTVNYDDEALKEIVLQEFGVTVEQLLVTVDESSLPAHRDERIAAVKAAGADFQDPVSTPMSDVSTLLNKDTDAATVLQILQRNLSEIEYKILVDVLFADQTAQMMAAANVEAITQNPWLSVMLADANTNIFANPDPNQRGFWGLTVLNPETNIRQHDMAQLLNRVRLVLLLRTFALNETVETRETIRNWRDNGAVDVSAMRFVESSEQENGPSMVLHHQYKFPTGEVETTEIGFNVYDRRGLIPAPAKEEEAPATGTGNPGTKPGGNPPATETPTSYTLTVKFVDGNGKDVATAKTESHKAGEEFTVYAEKVEGMTPDRQSITEKMPDGNHTVKFVYTKNTVSTYVLTVRFWKEQVGGESASPTVTYNFAPGKHDIQLPQVTGMKPKNGSYTITHNMPSHNDTLDVVYTADMAWLRIYYRSESGARMPGIPDYEKQYTIGAGFDIPTPSAGNRYEASQARVTGTMTKDGVTVTVTYYYLYEVNVSFKRTDTGEAIANPVIEYHRNGGYYNVAAKPAPKGFYAYPSSVTGYINNYDVYETIWYYPDGTPADGNNAKNEAADPVNIKQDGDPNKSNADKWGGANPAGSGTGLVNQGNLVDFQGTTYDPNAQNNNQSNQDKQQQQQNEIIIPAGSTVQNNDPPPAEPIQEHQSNYTNENNGNVVQVGGSGDSEPVHQGEAFTPPD